MSVVLTRIKDSDTNEIFVVNLNSLSFVEWDESKDRYRIHFLDNTLNIKMTEIDFLEWIEKNNLSISISDFN